MTYRGADPTAVMGRRIGAYLIDGFIAVAILLAVMIPLWQSTSVSAPSGTVECGTDSPGESPRLEGATGVRYSTDIRFCFDDGNTVTYIPEDKVGEFVATAGLVGGATSVVLLVLLQGILGASPGKLLFGLRVVKEDGSNAGIGRCLVRTILLPIDSVCCAIIGLLTAFNSQRHRRVGDMVASTMVIGRSDQDALILARSGQSLPGRVDLAGQQWAGQNQPGPPTAGTWDPYGGIQIPDDPAPTNPTAPSPWATPAAAPPADPGSAGEGPTWDRARNAYIQYDHARGAWMQYDDDARQWKPIDS